MVFNPIHFRKSIIRPALLLLGAIYFVCFIGIYRANGSINEWLHISTIGLNGGDHWGVLSHTYSLPTFARAIGVTTPESWRAMVQVIAVGSTVLLFYALSRIASNSLELLYLLSAVLCIPLIRGVFNGQADYDGITLIGSTLLLIAPSSAAALFVGALLGLTNPQQSGITLLMLIMVSSVVDKKRIKPGLFALTGLFASHAVLRFLLRDEEIIGRDRGLIMWGYRSLADFDRLVSYLPHLFAGYSLVIVALIVSAAIKREILKTVVLTLALVVVPFAVLLIHNDGSRIPSLVVFPSLIVAISSAVRLWPWRVSLLVITCTLVVQAIYVATGQLDFEPEFPTMFENLSSRPNPLP